ncbi:MAG: carbon storage regulator CsrA [Granulosicoccus sp.]
MLILTRRIDEKILIGDDIVLCVLDIEGSRVKLGLEAPRDIAILREEIQSRYTTGDAANDPRRDNDQKTSAG